MKIYTLIGIVLLLSACAGTPPAWWNPSGTYGTDAAAARKTQADRAVSSSSSKVTEEDETPAEQDIEPALDGYEEMNLSPIDEQAEAQRLLKEDAQAATANTSDQVQVPAGVQAATTQAKTEVFPPDNSLPAPSVLE